MSLFGIDASNHNTVDTVTANAKRSAFLIAKATEGMRSTDAAHGRHRTIAEIEGLVFGSYHFAWCSQDPISEVNNFLSVAKPQPGEVVALDLEDWGETDPTKPNYARDKAMRDATSWQMRVQYALKWLRMVSTGLDVKPWVYANFNWITNLRNACTQAQWDELTGYPLWLASPNGTPGTHSTVKSKDGTIQDDWPIVMHQYTFDWNGNDGNYFDRGPIDLLNYTIPVPEEVVDLTPIMNELAALKAGQEQIISELTVISTGHNEDAQILTEQVSQAKLAIINSVTTETSHLSQQIANVTGDIDSAVGTAVGAQLGGVEVTARFTKR